MNNCISGIDAVVMLTVSDWVTEPRSNRYHYAVRFARHWPVLFVQPDRKLPGYHFSPSGHPNIEILHVRDGFGEETLVSISNALNERNIKTPLLWILSAYYGDIAGKITSAIHLLHATEDYFQPELRRQLKKPFYDRLLNLFGDIDALVSVSDGVAKNYKANGYSGPILLAENGCDYEFWQSASGEVRRDKICLYQGGINYRLDANLIMDAAKRLPDWEFRFCGARDTRWKEWSTVLGACKNIVDLGNLTPDEFARESWRATVGIIPFIQTPIIVESSLPLKAFEYVACGLPVVTVPIKSLGRWPALFDFATNGRKFAEAISKHTSKVDDKMLRERASAASQRSYDINFEKVTAFIAGVTSKKRALARDSVSA